MLFQRNRLEKTRKPGTLAGSCCPPSSPQGTSLQSQSTKETACEDRLQPARARGSGGYCFSSGQFLTPRRRLPPQIAPHDVPLRAGRNTEQRHCQTPYTGGLELTHGGEDQAPRVQRQRNLGRHLSTSPPSK